MLLRKRPCNPEAVEVEPIRGIVPVADRATEVPRFEAPGTAPQDALLTITFIRTQPCTPISWGVFIGLMPAVFYPLLDIAYRVMHTKRICAV